MLEVCVRWYYSLFQHQDRFNHPCNSTGTFKVSNVTLDSPLSYLSVFHSYAALGETRWTLKRNNI